jgi:hypothetical protein
VLPRAGDRLQSHRRVPSVPAADRSPVITAPIAAGSRSDVNWRSNIDRRGNEDASPTSASASSATPSRCRSGACRHESGCAKNTDSYQNQFGQPVRNNFPLRHLRTSRSGLEPAEKYQSWSRGLCYKFVTITLIVREITPSKRHALRSVRFCGVMPQLACASCLLSRMMHQCIGGDQPEHSNEAKPAGLRWNSCHHRSRYCRVCLWWHAFDNGSFSSELYAAGPCRRHERDWGNTKITPTDGHQ